MSTAGPTSTSARPQGPGPRPAQGAQQASPTRPNPTQTQSRPGAPAGAMPSARNRRVKLTVSRVDPWSAMKMSFLISVALGIAGVVEQTLAQIDCVPAADIAELTAIDTNARRVASARTRELVH